MTDEDKRARILAHVATALRTYFKQTEGWREAAIIDVAPVVYGETPIPGKDATRFGFSVVLTSEFGIPQLGGTNVLQNDDVRLSFVQIGNSVHTHSLTTLVVGVGSEPPTHPGG